LYQPQLNHRQQKAATTTMSFEANNNNTQHAIADMRTLHQRYVSDITIDTQLTDDYDTVDIEIAHSWSDASSYQRKPFNNLKSDPLEGNTEYTTTPTKNQNKIAEINWDSLGLDPTKMLPMNNVLEQMEKDGEIDGTWAFKLQNQNNLPFRLIVQNSLTFRLIMFLYGTGFLKDLSSELRVKKIKTFITGHGNQKRLKLVAFSADSDSILQHEDGFYTYFFFARSCLLLFKSDPNSIGGFPVIPYYRIQASKNGYIVAVAMFLTLILQKQEQEKWEDTKKVLPIDVGWLGRRFVTGTLDGLQNRVIEDKGKHSIHLILDIIGKKYARHFRTVDLNYVGQERIDSTRDKENLDRYIRHDVDSYSKIGIVDSWRVYPNFYLSKTDVQAQEGFGYWKFDGDSVNCVGEFVEFDVIREDEFKSELANEYRNDWENQVENIKDKRKSSIERMQEILKLSPRDDNGEDDIDGENSKNRTTSHTNSNSQVHGLHAMLLLGSFTEPEKGKTLYVMWNWWERMPLVAVSLEYMIACQCQVYFLNAVLPKDLLQNLDAQRCDSLGCECSYPDGAGVSNTGTIFRY
jgi:hypothetical protein